ncbi:D-alanyl-D-alanine carboxypeptidase [Sphingomonas yunnanensis]|uniref:D-alanyl-D-alanine carboxypeptidase n=1 Tax=Sphingomonas yunnanensis TaxID=310400 RepID=UPI001CA79CC0|nr:D-alanyl-D-alanine carboxypeptidase [Sphingomonas yunnanensis]MBY9065111.1 D-alanyl-D-alanine carboxypeptidase [Sphingomonas yunnanensis]
MIVTLARRLAGMPPAGELSAETGSLDAANALSRFLVAASGRTLTFSARANDRPTNPPRRGDRSRSHGDRGASLNGGRDGATVGYTFRPVLGQFREGRALSLSSPGRDAAAE